MALMGDYFIVYMLRTGGWDWIIGGVCIQIGLCTLISLPVLTFTVSHLSIVMHIYNNNNNKNNNINNIFVLIFNLTYRRMSTDIV